MLFRDPIPFSPPGRPDVTCYIMAFRPWWCFWWWWMSVMAVFCAGIFGVAAYAATPAFLIAFPLVLLAEGVWAILPTCLLTLLDAYRVDLKEDGLSVEYRWKSVAIPYRDVTEMEVTPPRWMDGLCCCCIPADFVRLIYTDPSSKKEASILLMPACGAQVFYEDVWKRTGEGEPLLSA